jgi:hypothetical protein
LVDDIYANMLNEVTTFSYFSTSQCLLILLCLLYGVSFFIKGE